MSDEKIWRALQISIHPQFVHCLKVRRLLVYFKTTIKFILTTMRDYYIKKVKKRFSKRDKIELLDLIQFIS